MTDLGARMRMILAEREDCARLAAEYASGAAAANAIRMKDVELDNPRGLVLTSLDLPPQDYDGLLALAANAGETPEDMAALLLHKALWSYDGGEDDDD